MVPIRVIAMPTEVAQTVRATMKSPGYGHPAHADIATGHGPCRHCLRNFQVGEDRRILLTYNPFRGIEHLPLPGPVFIHEESCDRYLADAGFPPELRSDPLTFSAYAKGRRLLAEEFVTANTLEQVIEGLLAIAAIDYVHVSNTEAGCYDFRIERPAPGARE